MPPRSRRSAWRRWIRRSTSSPSRCSSAATTNTAPCATRLEPVLKQKLEAKGLVFLNWGDTGWVYLFSKGPVPNVDAIKKLRLYTSAGDDSFVQLYKQNGFNPRPLPFTEIQSGLMTGLLDAVPSTPLATLAFQWYRNVPEMLDLGRGPAGRRHCRRREGVEQHPAERPRSDTSRIAKKMQDALDRDVPAQDTQARAEMVKRGLKVTAPDPAAVRGFREMADKFAASMKGGVVPADIYDQATRERDAFRKTKRHEVSGTLDPDGAGRSARHRRGRTPRGVRARAVGARTGPADAAADRGDRAAALRLGHPRRHALRAAPHAGGSAARWRAGRARRPSAGAGHRIAAAIRARSPLPPGPSAASSARPWPVCWRAPASIMVRLEREAGRNITEGVPVWAFQVLLPLGFAAMHAWRIVRASYKLARRRGRRRRSPEPRFGMVDGRAGCHSTGAIPFSPVIDAKQAQADAAWRCRVPTLWWLLALFIGGVAGAPIFALLGGAAAIMFLSEGRARLGHPHPDLPALDQTDAGVDSALHAGRRAAGRRRRAASAAAGLPRALRLVPRRHGGGVRDAVRVPSPCSPAARASPSSRSAVCSSRPW